MDLEMTTIYLFVCLFFNLIPVFIGPSIHFFSFEGEIQEKRSKGLVILLTRTHKTQQDNKILYTQISPNPGTRSTFHGFVWSVTQFLFVYVLFAFVFTLQVQAAYSIRIPYSYHGKSYRITEGSWKFAYGVLVLCRVYRQWRIVKSPGTLVCRINYLQFFMAIHV